MMWARLCEMLLGAWLAASPFILPTEGSPRWILMNETVCGALCIAVAAVACLSPRRPWNLLQIPLGLWFASAAYFTSPSPATANAQNDLLTAFFLLNFAIIPTRTSNPPPEWAAEVSLKSSS
jgi:hypothetical protein